MRARLKLAAAIIAGVLGAMVFGVPHTANAHPMGNFSINHYTRISADKNAIEIRYLLDMAEIPTFQEIQRTGINPKGGGQGIEDYLRMTGETLKQHLVVKANGQTLNLEQTSHEAIFPPGAGGLPTMKLGFVYRVSLAAAVQSGPLEVEYLDDNFPGRAGWKEVIAVASGSRAIADSSVPAQDRSHELSNYPTDLLNSPPQTLEARVTFSLGVPVQTDVAAAAPLSLRANVIGTPRNAFTELMNNRNLSASFLLMAALIAAGLGGLHAMEPGHGKTLVAAYLVGSRSSIRHVVLLGTVVTASHTASVYLLGIMTLYASRWVMPDRLYPWLGVASGLLVASLGMILFARRYRGSGDAHDHRHGDDADALLPHRHNFLGEHVHADHEHTHSRDGHSHSHEGLAHHHQHSHGGHSHDDSGVSIRELLALGITGGIVPCPAALVVLLSALAIGRIVLGLFLIVAFSVGLAAVLIFFGIATLYARRLMSRFRSDSPMVSRWLPMTSSAMITIVGVTMTLTSLMNTGILARKL
jgi:nickel/cobalt transporter (NicO) family protein